MYLLEAILAGENTVRDRLTEEADQFARYLSQQGPVAYIEATFYGGYGGHLTMIWDHGAIVEVPGNDINKSCVIWE